MSQYTCIARSTSVNFYRSARIKKYWLTNCKDFAIVAKLYRREMISTSKMRAVVVGGHSSVQRSGHLPVRQLESLAADIVESDISIPFAGDYLN